jgi:hypothetical protein
MRKSLRISLIAVFGALHCVLYFVSFGLWRNWAIYVESVEGIILGPSAGFLAALVGSSIARTIRPDPFWMFGIVAEPVSVLVAGFLAAGKWKPSVAVYATMLAAYFIHPFGRELPLWTVLDLLAALLIIYPAARLSSSLFGTDLKRLSLSLCLVSFTCSATDALVRVFLLIPCGFYTLFPGIFSTFEEISAIFIAAAVSSYIEDALVVTVSLIAGVPIIIATSKLKLLQQKNRMGKND